MFSNCLFIIRATLPRTLVHDTIIQLSVFYIKKVPVIEYENCKKSNTIEEEITENLKQKKGEGKYTK